MIWKISIVFCQRGESYSLINEKVLLINYFFADNLKELSEVVILSNFACACWQWNKFENDQMLHEAIFLGDHLLLLFFEVDSFRVIPIGRFNWNQNVCLNNMLLVFLSDFMYTKSNSKSRKTHLHYPLNFSSNDLQQLLKIS